jgi:hypothetical protein
MITTVTIYYHFSLIMVIVGWLGFITIKSIIEMSPL